MSDRSPSPAGAAASRLRQRRSRLSTSLRYFWSRGVVLRWAVWTIGCAVVLWIAWIVVTGLLVRQDAASIRDRLVRLQAQVTQGDLAGARETAAGIPALAAHAHRLTTGPAWWAASELPLIGRPFEITRDAATVSDTVGRNGIPALLRVANQLDPHRLRKGPDTVDLAPLRQAAPTLARAAQVLDHAVARLRAIPSGSWLPPVNTARSSLVSTLQAVTGYVDAGARAARVLPPLLGADGPRRYFVALQNEAEMRGTGGLPGAFAIAVAYHGTVHFTHFESDSALQPAASGQLVPTGLNFGSDFQTAYAADGPTEAFVNSNMSPNFPYAAQIWAAMWTRTTGEHIDGAIALDPQVLANLLSATGPVSTPQGIPVSADNAVALTEQQEYSLFSDNDQRKQFLVDVLHRVADKVLDGTADPRLLVQAMSLSSREGRILLWSRQPETQNLISQTNYAGVIPDDARPFVGVVLNNTAAGKLDYYLNRSVHYQRIGCGPQRDMVVTITLSNDAPATGLPGYVVGRLDGAAATSRPGDNRTLLDYFATAGAELTSVTIDGKPATSAVLQDRGHPVFRFDLELPRGTTRTVMLHLSEPAGSGAVQVWRQPGVRPLTVDGLDQPCR